MKHIARVGKTWAKKGTDKLLGRELELLDGDSIDNYKMVPEPKKEMLQKEAPFTTYNKKEKGMFENA